MITLIKFWCWIGVVVFGMASAWCVWCLPLEGQPYISSDGVGIHTPINGLFYSLFRLAVCASIIYFL